MIFLIKTCNVLIRLYLIPVLKINYFIRNSFYQLRQF
nr:MAG TPA: hypothetical protein [Bacteriophage sp.]